MTVLASIGLSGCGDEPVSTLSVSELAAVQTEAVSLSDQLIPQTDLPPEGTRSFFDHLIANHGRVPYPFSELVNLVVQQDQNGTIPTNLMIPNGRSLLKGQADFKIPRILVAADAQPVDSDFELPPIFKGQLFFGFVEGATEVEVISYNDAAGRFEYQLIKDYCEGCNPRLVYAKRAICLTCHQGGAPIFPVRPWEETNGQPQIAHAIAEARGSSSDYEGLPIKQPLTAPETFDERTDVGNTIVALQKMWIDGCGENDDCRRGMLKLALAYMWNPGGFDWQSPEAKEQQQRQAKQWPKEGIPLRNGDLPNRNPLTEQPANQSFWSMVRGLFGDGKKPVREIDSDDHLAAFESLPPLRIDVDPLTRREPRAMYMADSLESVVSLAQMFSDSDRKRLEKASQWSLAAIQAAVDDIALPAAPFSRILTMQALLKGLGQPHIESAYIDTSAMSAPIVDGAPPLDISEGSVLKVFETYCFACHRGNPNAKLDFMNGADEQTVLESIQATDSISDALDYERFLGGPKATTLMPPGDSFQRRLLDQSRANQNGELELMQDTIPSLFDF